MKYKPGDKFILEIDKPMIDDSGVYSIKGGACMLTEYILDNLKPYPRGIEVKEKAEYQRGLADAWEAARKIGCDDGLSLSELIDIFGIDEAGDILKDNTAAEAIAKIRAYEEEKEIKVGDEITLLNGLHAVVIKTADSTGKIVSMMSNGNVCSSLKEQVKKTGKHFEEVSAVQDKLLESEEDET